MKKMPLKLTPAPGDLQLVVDFVNTADHRKGTEALSSPAALATWLQGQGLLAAAVELSAADLEPWRGTYDTGAASTILLRRYSRGDTLGSKGDTRCPSTREKLKSFSPKNSIAS